MKYFRREGVRGLMVAVTLIVAVTLSVTARVYAQDYPKQDITFIVPFVPGGSADPLGRQFAKQLEKALGRNVNVENKPGGSATIGAGVVVRAKPDGYTIGVGSISALAYQPLVTRGLPYKTPDDYQSIVKLSDVPIVLAVRADAPWKTYEEFMADVRKKPGEIRSSVSGLRTVPDLMVQELNKVAGVKITTVPFTGGAGEALVALLGGRVEAMVNSATSVIGHVQGGTVRVLAMFRKGKYELFPDATPIVDAGYKVALTMSFYVIAPKGMPKNVQDKLVPASLQVVRSEEFIKFLKATGNEGDAKGPEAAKSEIVQQGKVFSDLIKFLEKK